VVVVVEGEEEEVEEGSFIKDHKRLYPL